MAWTASEKETAGVRGSWTSLPPSQWCQARGGARYPGYPPRTWTPRPTPRAPATPVTRPRRGRPRGPRQTRTRGLPPQEGPRSQTVAVGTPDVSSVLLPRPDPDGRRGQGRGHRTHHGECESARTSSLPPVHAPGTSRFHEHRRGLRDPREGRVGGVGKTPPRYASVLCPHVTGPSVLRPDSDPGTGSEFKSSPTREPEPESRVRRDLCVTKRGHRRTTLRSRPSGVGSYTGLSLPRRQWDCRRKSEGPTREEGEGRGRVRLRPSVSRVGRGRRTDHPNRGSTTPTVPTQTLEPFEYVKHRGRVGVPNPSSDPSLGREGTPRRVTRRDRAAPERRDEQRQRKKRGTRRGRKRVTRKTLEPSGFTPQALGPPRTFPVGT